jgi:universal stress protein A
LDKAAREQLGTYGDQYGVAKNNQVVTVGRPESEIHRLAKEQEVDLVIVGSHGRKGFQLLLGSTANGVLHGTECDVLAVRIH